MYIKCKTFNEWLGSVSKMKESGISPGGMAKHFNVTRQTVNNWINNDIIDAYLYNGKEGEYVIIDTGEYEKVKSYKGK